MSFKPFIRLKWTSHYPVIRQIFVVATSFVILGSSCGPSKKNHRKDFFLDIPKKEEVVDQNEENESNPEGTVNDFGDYYSEEDITEEGLGMPIVTEEEGDVDDIVEPEEDTDILPENEFYEEEDDLILSDSEEDGVDEELTEEDAIDFDTFWDNFNSFDPNEGVEQEEPVIVDTRPLRNSHPGTGFLNFFKKNYETISGEAQKFFADGTTNSAAAYSSTALKLAGYNVNQVNLTNQLEGELLRLKWKRVSTLLLQKGDVVFTTKEGSGISGTYSHVFIHGGYTGPLRRFSRATDNQGVSYERNLFFQKGGKTKAIFAYRPPKLEL